MTPTSGWTWDRNWFSLARLMQDGEVIGEAALHNGVWTGRYRGRDVMTSGSLDTVSALRTVMAQAEEIARRTE